MKPRKPTVWMWGDALELLERADRLHRQFFQPGQQRNQCPTWEPPVDMLENERELAIYVALPGVSEEQLDVTIEGAAVMVRGRRTMPDLRGSAAIRRLEIPYGRFERCIELPVGQFQVEQRSLQDGCLVLVLSKLR
jgi:HSP20 family protein